MMGLWHQERYRQQNRFRSGVKGCARCQQGSARALPPPCPPPGLAPPPAVPLPHPATGTLRALGAGLAPPLCLAAQPEGAITKETLTAPPSDPVITSGAQSHVLWLRACRQRAWPGR